MFSSFSSESLCPLEKVVGNISTEIFFSVFLFFFLNFILSFSPYEQYRTLLLFPIFFFFFSRHASYTSFFSLTSKRKFPSALKNKQINFSSNYTPSSYSSVLSPALDIFFLHSKQVGFSVFHQNPVSQAPLSSAVTNLFNSHLKLQ